MSTTPRKRARDGAPPAGDVQPGTEAATATESHPQHPDREPVRGESIKFTDEHGVEHDATALEVFHGAAGLVSVNLAAPSYRVQFASGVPYDASGTLPSTWRFPDEEEQDQADAEGAPTDA